MQNTQSRLLRLLARGEHTLTVMAVINRLRPAPDNVDTVAVDRDGLLYVNDGFVDTLTDDEMLAVFRHELMTYLWVLAPRWEPTTPVASLWEMGESYGE